MLCEEEQVDTGERSGLSITGTHERFGRTARFLRQLTVGIADLGRH